MTAIGNQGRRMEWYWVDINYERQVEENDDSLIVKEYVSGRKNVSPSMKIDDSRWGDLMKERNKEDVLVKEEVIIEQNHECKEYSDNVSLQSKKGDNVEMLGVRIGLVEDFGQIRSDIINIHKTFEYMHNEKEVATNRVGELITALKSNQRKLCEMVKQNPWRIEKLIETKVKEVEKKV